MASGAGVVPGGSRVRPLSGSSAWSESGGLAAAAFGRVLALAVIPRLVGGDAEEPGLKLAAAVEGIEVPDDGQEDFLANLLDVLAREIVPELKDKAPRRRVMPVEQLVPGPRLTTAAARKQVSFGVGTHADSDSI